MRSNFHGMVALPAHTTRILLRHGLLSRVNVDRGFLMIDNIVLREERIVLKVTAIYLESGLCLKISDLLIIYGLSGGLLLAVFFLSDRLIETPHYIL